MTTIKNKMVVIGLEISPVLEHFLRYVLPPATAHDSAILPLLLLSIFQPGYKKKTYHVCEILVMLLHTVAPVFVDLR
jgi:hypothetical protein